MLDLILRERGLPVAVTPDQWRHLKMEDIVAPLSRHGILRVERTTAAILLFPSHFVGELRAPGLRLTIQAKDQPFFEAVLKLAVESSERKTHHQELKTSAGEGEDLATPYVRALENCVDEGLPWQYMHSAEATSRPKGRPNFAKTISEFVSRGIQHRIVAAYLCLPEVYGATQALISRAAILIDALEVYQELSIPAALEGGAALLAEEHLLSKSARALLDASMRVLEGVGRVGTALMTVPSGVARFVNVERVWEQAVAGLVRTAFPDSSVALHGLASAGFRLFGHRGPTIDPDVVGFSEDGSISLIADAKYKVLGENDLQGISTDVYQLTCYVERTQATIGVLIYVGTSDGVVELGRTQMGCRILVVRISASRLISDRQEALSILLGATPVVVDCI
jgi:hypothetical protein